MSMVLRHNPLAIGLHLDEGGWVLVSELSSKARAAGVELPEVMIREIVRLSDKQRFCLSPDGLWIRANHGHSIKVDLGLDNNCPPEFLYHGTARRNFSAISAGGILPVSRQMVHLAADMESALAVGARHGNPAVITVFARQMWDAGLVFYRSESGVWLTAKVPVLYLQFPEWSKQ